MTRPAFPPPYTRTMVLGLGHKARQGKNAVVRLLQAQFPGRVLQVGFADALKAVARSEHGMTAKDAPLLQRMGTERRLCDINHWVRVAAWTIAELDADAPQRQVVCVPDVRFPNEAEWIKSCGGLLWCVERWGADGRRVIDPSRPADHPSETALDGWAWDGLVCNDSSLKALRGAVADLSDPLRDYLAPIATPAGGGGRESNR